jgi:uncharacterized oligopeptide transporter (OPT) family protein
VPAILNQQSGELTQRKELTLRGLLLGVVITLVFTAANA